MNTTNNIIILSILASMLLGCNKKGDLSSKKEEMSGLQKQKEEIIAKIVSLEKEIALLDTSVKIETNIKLVAIKELKRTDFNHFIELNGRIETDQNVTISALSGGNITRIDVKRGQKVRKGQVLGAIDNDLILKGISELKSGLKLANTVFEKQSKLWEQQIGTELQYLQAKNSKESLEIRLESLNKQYDMTLFKSTIDGTIDEVYIKQGEVTAPGMPAFRIVNTSGYKLVSDVPEGYLSKVKVGNKVLINIPDLDKSMESSVVNVSDVINTSTRTFRIEISLKGDIKNYKANMLAYIKIQDFKKENTITVPINLVERQEDKDYIFLANNNKVNKKEIKIGQIYKTNAEVIDGLKDGDKIIVTGYQDLVDGQTIKY